MTACFLISLLLAVPFLFFMTLFTPWLIEGGPGPRPLAAHFQVRPNPLAK